MRIYNFAVAGMALISAALIFVVMGMVSIDVVWRVVVGRSIGWVFEFAGHIMVFILVLGMPQVARKGGHVVIDIFVQNASPKVASLFRVLSMSIAIISCAVIAYAAGAMALADLDRSIMTSGVYPLPRAIITAPIGIGFAFTAIEFLILLVKGKEDSPEAP